MTTRTRIALMFTAGLAAAPQVHAQRHAAIPFHTSAVGDATLDETLTGVFSGEVPVGKRLVVQHVSLIVLAAEITEIVSDSDLDPVAPGVQNVWVQEVGCATDAVVSFN